MRLGKDDLAVLHQIDPLLEDRLDAVVVEYLNMLAAHHQELLGREVDARLRGMRPLLRSWLIRFFKEERDATYEAGVVKLGQAQLTMGVPIAVVFAAMERTQDCLLRLIDETSAGNAALATSRRMALTRALFADLTLMVSNYLPANVLRVLDPDVAMSIEADSANATLVAGLDVSGRIIDCNHAFAEMCGGTEDALAGHFLWERAPIENSDSLERSFTESIAGQQAVATIDYWLNSQCERRLIAWVSAQCAEVNGASARAIGVGIDITGIANYAEEKVHRESMARLGEMAGVIAHEVRNPLAAIAGAMQVLTGRLGAENAEVAELLMQRVRALGRLVRDLLDYAHPPDVRMGAVSLLPMLKEIVRVQRLEAVLGSAEVSVSGDEVTVRGDVNQLTSAFENLIQSASKAISGQGVISISVSGGQDCNVVVADSGPSIPQELLASVFEPFSNLRRRGTGVGLALARRIIEDHEGRIDVECPLTGGTQFNVVLPLATATR